MSGPILLLLLGATILGAAVFGMRALVPSLALAAAAGWPWWSYVVPRWRRWAHARGADPARLQLLAQATGLVWPKGFPLERTEFTADEDRHRGRAAPRS